MSSASKKVITPQLQITKPASFIHYCFYTLFFVTPLLLWPFTSEVFEFNKMMFVYVMTIIIATSWAIRSFQQKSFQIARTPLDIPILLFLTSQIISTFVSIDRHTSLWGYYSRFHGGLVSTICYIVLFYALTTHFSGQKKAIKTLISTILATATITSVYAVLEKMGIDKNVWVQDVQNRVFSTLGQPNWLSAYLIALLPLSLYGLLNSKSFNSKLLNLFLSALYLTVIIFTKSQSGIGATAIVLVIFFIVVTIQRKQTKILAVATLLLIGLLILKANYVQRTLASLNKINPFYSNTLSIIEKENETRIGGSDSMTIRRVVWQGAIELGKKYPFFGTGVETFGYTYYWVRPAAHNLTSEADFLYNKAHNEYLNFLANTGFFGLLSYILLIGTILSVFIKSKENDLRIPLLLGFTSILITNYFGFSVVDVALFFFLYPAIYISYTKESLVSKNLNINSTIGIIVISILALWLLLGVRNMWVADIDYTAGRSNLTKNLEAVQLNPREPNYYAQLGNVQALVATQIIKPQIDEMTASTSADLKEKANAYLQQYTTDALNNVSKAVSMNRYNLNLLKTKARTELTLGLLNPKYNYDAIQTMLKITELSPTEATNYYNIGILYSTLAQTTSDSKVLGTNNDSKSILESAKLAFQKAIELKPDYETAKDRLNQISK